MSNRLYATYDSIIGDLHIICEDEKIVSIYLNEADFFKNEEFHFEENYKPDHPVLSMAVQQLSEYFSGQRTNFNLPIEYSGTPFQLSVWNVLRNIPFGQTKNYQEVAHAINNLKAVRAVGLANKANKLPIVIPCHRVIGKNQTLTGYAGKKVDIKQKLLEIEGVNL